MRQFLIGTVIGAFLMYGFIHYVPKWTGSGSQWIEGAASDYRGDRRDQRARDALR